MKRLRMLMLFTAAMVLACFPVLAGGKSAPGGKIVNTQGQTIEVVEFLDLVSTLPFMLEQSEQSAPLHDIASLTDLGDGYVELKNFKGETFKVVVLMGAVSLGEMIKYKTMDPVSGKIGTSSIDGEFVQQIVFDWKK